MTAANKLKTFGVIDPGPNVLLEVLRATTASEAVRHLEEKMRGAEYAQGRTYTQGGEDSLDGQDPAYLVYDLTDSGLDEEGLSGDDAGQVRAQAEEVGVFVSAPKK